MTPFLWLPEHIAAIRADDLPTAPIIASDATRDVLPGWDVWDHWPLLTRRGDVARVADGSIVFALVAPRGEDPNERHGAARLWLFHAGLEGWRALGPVFAEGAMPGARQWSGSAVLEEDATVRLFFTAVGERGETMPATHQRLFETRGVMRVIDGVPAIDGWRAAIECARPDGVHYQQELDGGGEIGTIKAFRDPFFVSLAGEDWLLFAASDAASRSAWNGAVGAARWEGGCWVSAPPLVRASGLNNELERPHAISRADGVYLFWSTQAHVFAEGGPRGPTGLYGICAEAWGTPWQPLNGSTLVFANPPSAPVQAYSFQVLADLSVWSFADLPQRAAIPGDRADRRAAFAGGPAPVLQLALDGTTARLTS